MSGDFRNSIQRISNNEFETIKQSIFMKQNACIVEMDGYEIQSWKSYIGEIENKFKFPTTCIDSVDRYLDWIRDLSWLEKEEYVLIIYNFEKFLSNDLELKNEIIMCFEEYILPFWQSEVEEVVVEGKAKSFMVYFVD